MYTSEILSPALITYHFSVPFSKGWGNVNEYLLLSIEVTVPSIRPEECKEVLVPKKGEPPDISAITVIVSPGSGFSGVCETLIILISPDGVNPQIHIPALITSTATMKTIVLLLTFTMEVISPG